MSLTGTAAIFENIRCRQKFEQIVSSVEETHANGIRVCRESYSKLEISLREVNEALLHIDHDSPLAVIPELPECKTMSQLILAIESLSKKVDRIIAEKTRLTKSTQLTESDQVVETPKVEIPKVVSSVSAETKLPTLAETKSGVSDSKDKKQLPLYDAIVFEPTAIWHNFPLGSSGMLVPTNMTVPCQLHYIVKHYDGTEKADKLPNFDDGKKCHISIVGYVEDAKAKVFLVNDPEEYAVLGVGVERHSYLTYAHVSGLDRSYGARLIKSNIDSPCNFVGFEKPVTISGFTKRIYAEN